MKLTVIASGSSGNCYVLEGRDSALIIECGVPPEEMMRRTPTLRMSKVAGCLVSHEHGDHARYAQRYADLGIPFYCSPGTWGCIAPKGTACHLRHDFMLFPVGGFQVVLFQVYHDADQPTGFLIQHPECGRILFITDTAPIPYCFKDYGIDHIMVEANYDDGLLDGNVATGKVNAVQALRTRQTHLSIRQAIELVRANETGHLKTVTLLHLSNRNADAEAFRKKMQESVVFADVYVASPGLEIPLKLHEI